MGYTWKQWNIKDVNQSFYDYMVRFFPQEYGVYRYMAVSCCVYEWVSISALWRPCWDHFDGPRPSFSTMFIMFHQALRHSPLHFPWLSKAWFLCEKRGSVFVAEVSMLSAAKANLARSLELASGNVTFLVPKSYPTWLWHCQFAMV